MFYNQAVSSSQLIFMFNKFFGLLSSDMAIDLGTANTLVYVTGKGIVLNEPSVVAVATINAKPTVLAVGAEAKRMLGRTPDYIRAVRPLRDGVIADFEITQEMIKYFIKRVHNRNIFTSPRIVICVPYGATAVERKAIEEAAETAGAREVYLIEEPMAAAIGAGLPVSEPRGSIVVDIGGGTTEVAVVSLGGIVLASSLRVGGNRMDEEIIDYVRKTFNLLIGDATAERIKQEIGSAIISTNSQDVKMVLRGRSLNDGNPQYLEINQTQVAEALASPVKEIANGVRHTLERTPPELVADIIESGITLTGGGALLANLPNVIAKATGVPVNIADTPLDCVVLGVGASLGELKKNNAILRKAC